MTKKITSTIITKDNANTLDYAELTAYIVNYLVRNFQKRYNLQPETAEDMAQNAFIKMNRFLNEGGEIEYPKTWLAHVARNDFLNLSRKAGWRKEKSATSLHIDQFEVTAPEARVALSGMFLPAAPDDNAAMKYIKDAFAKLTPAHKEILQAWVELEEANNVRYRAGEKHKKGDGISVQLGERLGIPFSTVKTRMYRAKGALRRQLDSVCENNPDAANVIAEALDILGRDPAGAAR